MSVPRHYLRLPARKAPLAPAALALRALRAGVLAPVSWARGRRAGLPGLDFRGECARFGLRALLGVPSRRLLRLAYELLVIPIHSTRHFELGFVWRLVEQSRLRRYADVSSPRCLPLVLLRRFRDLSADLVNPDAEDLGDSLLLARAAGIGARVRFHTTTIGEAPLVPGHYDLVTSISVIEHIPADRAAISRVWSLVAPGGRLVVSVPCRRVGREERIDVDHYGVVARDDDGFYFHQWVYDEQLLQERFFSVAGRPRHTELWGEIEDGALRRQLDRQWSDARYPFWDEPVSTARGFARFDRLEELPGEGVLMMEFVRD